MRQMNTDLAIFHQALRNQGVRNSEAAKYRGVSQAVDKIQSAVDAIRQAGSVRHTSWFTLLCREPDGRWHCLGCYDMNNLPEGLPEDFTILLPIPDPESLAEFEGF